MKQYSNILISLLKGIVYSHSKYWNDLLNNEQDVKNYFSDINLDVIIDKSEGYAYLRQKEDDDNDDNEEALRLIDKRQLEFHVSLLCLLLRRHLIENDSEGEINKAILSKDSIITMMRPFYKATTNEEKDIKQIAMAIKKVEKEGFLRRMKTEEEQYEISRIIRAFIDVKVVNAELEKLRNYVNSESENAGT